MKKDYYESSTGFFSNKLMIQFLIVRMLKTCSFIITKDSPFYHILYAQSGNYRIFYSGKTMELSSGDIAVFMPFEDYSVLSKKDTKNELVKITFDKSIFRFADEKESFLRAFSKRKKGENNIYKKAETDDFDFQKSIFNPIYNYKNNNLDEESFVSAISFLVSQLGIYYDSKNNEIPAVNSKEYRVIVYDYIQRNFNTNITVASVAEAFFVSKSYVNRVVGEFYNSSFHEMIKSLRMWTAKELIKNKTTLKDVGTLCGYSTYSGFYRCYTKFFGVSPADDKKEYETTGKFLPID